MSPFWISLELRMTEVVSGDNYSSKMCKAPVKSSPPTNQHPAFSRPDALSVAQPTVSEHWREKVSHSTDLLTPKLTCGSSNLGFQHQRLLVTLHEGCQASRRPADASTLYFVDVTLLKYRFRSVPYSAEFMQIVSLAYYSASMWTHTHALRFNGHFSRWTWVSQLPP